MTTKYEIREGNTSIQFDTFENAQSYNPLAEIFEVDVNTQINEEPTGDDWYNLEQDLFKSALFSKGITSAGNGFPLLLKVLTNGNSKGTSQNALLLAIQLTISGISNFTAEDVTALNNYLQIHNFRIRL